jgi:Flp pilus assembly protein TadG
MRRGEGTTSQRSRPASLSHGERAGVRGCVAGDLGKTCLQLFFQARGALDEKGGVLIEAAIILPVLLIVFLGMVEFSNVFTAKRRVQAVASTTADLVSQAKSVTVADLSDIARIGAQVMLPFASTGLTLKIHSVAQDAQSRITEQWSCSWTSVTATPSCTATGLAYTGAPSGILRAGQSVIIGEASYAFRPAAGLFIASGVTLNAASYFRPRLVSSVPLQ